MEYLTVIIIVISIIQLCFFIYFESAKQHSDKK